MKLRLTGNPENQMTWEMSLLKGLTGRFGPLKAVLAYYLVIADLTVTTNFRKTRLTTLIPNRSKLVIRGE